MRILKRCDDFFPINILSLYYYIFFRKTPGYTKSYFLFREGRQEGEFELDRRDVNEGVCMDKEDYKNVKGLNVK